MLADAGLGGDRVQLLERRLVHDRRRLTGCISNSLCARRGNCCLCSAPLHVGCCIGAGRVTVRRTLMPRSVGTVPAMRPPPPRRVRPPHAPQGQKAHKIGLAIGMVAPQGAAEHAPQGRHGPDSPARGETKLERADAALAALARTWSNSTSIARSTGAKEIARAFHRCLAAEPDLVGLCVPSDWICAQYSVFCKWLGSDRAPPYRDFARELAFLMPRERQETWRDGRRVVTRTFYLIAFTDAAQAAPPNPQSCESSVVCLELDRKSA